MDEKQKNDTPQEIPREPPPNYDDAMASTGKKWAM